MFRAEHTWPVSLWQIQGPLRCKSRIRLTMSLESYNAFARSPCVIMQHLLPVLGDVRDHAGVPARNELLVHN
jgi:hypothetical protein